MFAYVPVACCSLWRCVAIVINGIEQASLYGIGSVLKEVKCGIERQTSAHPKEHAGAQSIARCPEIIIAIACIFQIGGHWLSLFLCFEWGQLQTQRAAILIGQKVIQFRWIGIHAANEILYAIQMYGGNTLTCNRKAKRKKKPNANFNMGSVTSIMRAKQFF